MNFKITSLHAYISEDENGDEGICAFRINGEWMPMVAVDEKRLTKLYEWAKEARLVTGKKITLVKFNWREDVGAVE